MNKSNNIRSDLKLNQSLFERYKIFVIRGLTLVVLVFLGTRVTIPMVDSIREVQARIEQKKERLLLLSNKEDFLKRQNQGTLSYQVQKLNAALPSVIDLPLILATLQKVASDTNIELGEFSLSSRTQVLTVTKIQQGETLTSFQFNVSLAGSLESMEQFIEKLATVSPMLRMAGIDFSNEQSKTTLSFYFQPQPGRAPIDAPISELTQAQKNAITEVSSLEPPALVEPVVGSLDGQVREDPFR